MTASWGSIASKAKIRKGMLSKKQSAQARGVRSGSKRTTEIAYHTPAPRCKMHAQVLVYSWHGKMLRSSALRPVRVDSFRCVLLEARNTVYTYRWGSTSRARPVSLFLRCVSVNMNASSTWPPTPRFHFSFSSLFSSLRIGLIAVGNPNHLTLLLAFSGRYHRRILGGMRNSLVDYSKSVSK